MMEPSGLDGCHAARDVSRETEALLDRYSQLVSTWNKKINLVSPATLASFRQRHIEDSIQVLDAVMPAAGHWVDVGSGAGLPGLPVAIAARDIAPDLTFTLVEADQRKAAFLMEAARTLALDIRVISRRIEDIPSLGARFFSARALASLDKLCEMAVRHLETDGTCVFPKGRDADREIAEARQIWAFDCRKVPSRTDADASILIITELRRAA